MIQSTIDRATKLIKEFEGCLLHAYLDSAGIPTIGYGHTGPEVYMGQVITQEEAEALLLDDIDPAIRAVDTFVTVELTPCAQVALVSFIFNIGVAAFKHSTLLTKLNQGDTFGAAQQFLRWNHAGGVVVPGLTKRRQREKAIFEEDPCQV